MWFTSFSIAVLILGFETTMVELSRIVSLIRRAR
jgi:hypothetical protein